MEGASLASCEENVITPTLGLDALIVRKLFGINRFPRLA
jgi:hypothetical protein